MTSRPIALSRVHYPVQALGPGRRVGIWFQGCSIRCKGCISLDTWAQRPAEQTVERLLHSIEPWIADADGITISGGEPFDQGGALEELLRGLRRQPGKDILVYSGYPLERLDLSKFAGLIDAIVADPFEVDQPQTLALRGSDNQRLLCLTELGRERLGSFDRPVSEREYALDLMFADNQVFMAGIPARGDLARLRLLLAQDGHQLTTTEDERDAYERS
jgi:anaerobic ribonucleoside-triphosphate reductase activating protein